MRLIYSVVFSALLIIGCENYVNRVDVDALSETVSEIDEINEDFYAFLEKFNSDKYFQLKRIEFPYRSEYLDYDSNNEDYMMYTDFISKEEHKHLDFSDLINPSPGYNECTVHAEIEKIKATIIYSGIDNGIHSEFYFSLKNGKWYYVGNSDTSM